MAWGVWLARWVKTLAWLAVSVGVPAAGIGLWWRNSSVHHPWAAGWLVLAWEVLVGGGSLLGRVAGKPVQRRLEQIGNALDLALGRRVTRYGDRYRQYTLAALRFVDSKGLATTGESTPELDEVFVDVSLAPQAPHLVGGGFLADVPVDVTARRSIWDFVDGEVAAVLAVIGAPGSGKTTLLRHVARRIARDPERRRTLPIMLELRDHAGRLAADAAVSLPQVLRDTIPDLGVAEPTGWWEEQLRRGGCVVLLDGLDEVARAQDQRRTAEWIEAQIAAYPGNDFVVTSRPHGYRTAVIASALTLQVRPFTAEQVEQFLRGWYRAVERRATASSGPDVDLRAQKAVVDLLERLAGAPALSDLTANPLLLTMIANVHRYRGALPGSRADLYGEVCQVMLWRRAEVKRLPSALSGAIKERLLAQLAYEMMGQKVRDLPRNRVLELIRPGLRRAPGMVSAEDFLAEVGSNGLLVERERDLYAFAHLTFQEYLAAVHIRDKGLVAVLAAGVGDGWWRETILLYVAGADADPIVRACLDVGTITALSMAYDCSEADSDLAPALRDALERMVAQAFERDAEPEHRRLVAGVLATRHLAQVISIPTGSSICPRAIPANLYHLFLQDTATAAPDGHRSSDALDNTAATGIWAQEAARFSTWINNLASDFGRAVYRVPTVAELDQLTAARATTPARWPHIAHAWATSAPGSAMTLWSAPGQPSPRALPAAKLLDAVIEDVSTTPILTQLVLLSAHCRANLIHHTAEQYPGVTKDAVLIRALTLSHARDMACAQSLAHAQGSDLDDRLMYALEFDPMVTHEPGSALSHARARNDALDLAARSDPPRTLVTALALDQTLRLDRRHLLIRDVARCLLRDIDRTSAPASIARRHRDRGPDTELAHLLARDSDLDNRITQIKGLVDNAAMGPSLTRAMLTALEHIEANARHTPHRCFAETLIDNASISMSGVGNVHLDDLAQVVGHACTTISSFAINWWEDAVARRFADNSASVFGRREPVTPIAAAGIRLAALALAPTADETCGQHIGDVFRAAAVGITLLQQRRNDPASLETLILVRD